MKRQFGTAMIMVFMMSICRMPAGLLWADAETADTTTAATDTAKGKIPSGWSKGEKKGWKGGALPPGLAKKTGGKKVKAKEKEKSKGKSKGK